MYFFFVITVIVLPEKGYIARPTVSRVVASKGEPRVSPPLGCLASLWETHPERKEMNTEAADFPPRGADGVNFLCNDGCLMMANREIIGPGPSSCSSGVFSGIVLDGIVRQRCAHFDSFIMTRNGVALTGRGSARLI